MFKISTISRIAVATVVAGLSVSAASGAAQANSDLDNIFPAQPKRTQPATPAYRVPATPRRPRLTPAARSGIAKRLFVGTWSVKLNRGGHIGIRFMANGTYFLINSRRNNVIEVGRWAVRNGGRKLVLLPAGVCARNDMKNCRRYQNRKPITVSFRFVNRNRVIAPSGVFTRHA